MQLFEVWTEGYNVTGNICRATFHGKFKGETFKDAVIAFKESLNDIELVDTERMTFWGCALFDNEADARKSYG